MDLFVSYTITGLFFGAAYAVAASGLVLTYTTTRVFNLGHGVPPETDPAVLTRIVELVHAARIQPVGAL